MAIDDLFFNEGLAPCVDYHISAHTLSRGTIYIGIDLYTQEAKALNHKIPKLKIDLDDDTLNIAILQIISEEEQKLGSPGKENDFTLEPIRIELDQIDEKPWQDIDDVDIIDPQNSRLVAGSLYLPKEKEEFPARKVKVTFALEQHFVDSNKQLLPLFWELATLMSESAMADLYAMIGLYSKGVTRQPKHQALKLIHLFHIPHTYPLELSNVLTEIKDTLFHLRDTSAFKRLATELRMASHSNPDRILPGPHYIYERTNIIIGSKGWHRIATDENCNLILSHMKITVSTGHKRISTKVSSALSGE